MPLATTDTPSFPTFRQPHPTFNPHNLPSWPHSPDLIRKFWAELESHNHNHIPPRYKFTKTTHHILITHHQSEYIHEINRTLNPNMADNVERVDVHAYPPGTGPETNTDTNINTPTDSACTTTKTRKSRGKAKAKAKPKSKPGRIDESETRIAILYPVSHDLFESDPVDDNGRVKGRGETWYEVDGQRLVVQWRTRREEGMLDWDDDVSRRA